MEKFLVSAKHKLGFGREVDLMHPQQKEKPSGAPYNFADLVFGSAEENKEYNQGLDRMRSSLTNALKVIKYDYEGKDLNQKIKVPFVVPTINSSDKKEIMSALSSNLLFHFANFDQEM